MATFYDNTVGDRETIYTAAHDWQQHCLIEDGSLLFQKSLWTLEHLYALKTRLQLRPETSSTFDDTLQQQLAGSEQALYALMIDVLYVYYLFPHSGSVRYETKLRKLHDVASWGDVTLPEHERFTALQHGIGATGTFYNTAKHNELLYIIHFALALKYMSATERQAVLRSPWEGLKRLSVEARQTVRKNVQMQHILAHLLAPTYYECIASSTHKLQIVDAFKHLLKHDEEDIDRQLYDIRQELEQQMDVVHFYDEPLYSTWQHTTSIVAEEKAQYVPKKPKITLQGLVFDDEGGILQSQLEAALYSGKHIILTGPPGTGKSKLAKLICEQLEQPYQFVTASANWTAYDTIGGYRPTKSGALAFFPGLFLHAMKPHEKWLIIDEINRANIDEAFSALFSVLAGDDVTLPYEAQNGQLVTVTTEQKRFYDDHEYAVSPQWRIIGTMNTSDKASLFDMSYAFMRRFAFIPVPVPKVITASLVEEYAQSWGMRVENSALIATLWQTINELRKLGPAIIEDIVRYAAASEQDDITSALMLYVVPQLEGVSPYKIEAWLHALDEQFAEHIAVPLLRSFCEDFFQLRYER